MTALELLSRRWMAERYPNVTYESAKLDGTDAVIAWSETGVVFMGQNTPSNHAGTARVHVGHLLRQILEEAAE